MQNNQPNNDYQDDRVDLREYLKLLISSKKIIITITLICTLIAVSFTYTKQPMFESSVTFEIGIYKEPIYVSSGAKVIGFYKEPIYESGGAKVIGFYNNTPTNDINVIKDEINFHFTQDVKFLSLGPKFFAIKLISSSIESSENSLNEIIDYVINSSQKIINQEIQKDRFNLAALNNQISSIEVELTKISNQENIANSDSIKAVFVSELNLQLNQLKFQRGLLTNKLNNSDLYESTKVYQEIETRQLHERKGFTISLGLIAGLLLSILIVFIRQATIKE